MWTLPSNCGQTKKGCHMVQEGQRAPAFTMPNGGGGEVALKDLKGKKVELFFYPRDDSGEFPQDAFSLGHVG